MGMNPPSDGLDACMQSSLERGHSISRSIMVATSAVVEGIPDEQKSSPVRRVFCLLCLFDLICIFIIWVIYVRLITTGDIGQGLAEQVHHFRMQSSMFDVMMLALLRLLIQELAYGILKARRPWWTALSTTITCAYLLVKIFYYDFKHDTYNKNSINVMDYLLMLSSFVICWAETWFLDFRVLPKEKAARQLTEEASSLLPSTEGQSSFVDRRFRYGAFDPRERFFSPTTTSPVGTHFSTARPTVYHSLSGSPVTNSGAQVAEIQQLLLKASETFDQACSLFGDGHEWTHERGDAIQGCVYSRKINRRTRIYKVEVLLTIASQRLYLDFIENVSQTPDWNPSVAITRRVQMLARDVDVLYSVSTEQLKGAVSPRDAVTIRKWCQISPRLSLIAVQSVEHSACPPERQFVRAISGVGLMAFEDVSGMEGQCKFTWVLNTNLKGWLPQTIVEQCMTTVMFNYLGDLRSRCSFLNGEVEA